MPYLAIVMSASVGHVEWIAPPPASGATCVAKVVK